MKTTSLTKKGQVTIPKQIRLLLGLAPHDRVAFEVQDNAVILRRAPAEPDQEADRMLREFAAGGSSEGADLSGSPLELAGAWKDADFVDEMLTEIYERRKRSGRTRRSRLRL